MIDPVMNIPFEYVAYAYVALLFAFSICLILVAGEANRRPARLWLISNILAGIAMLLFVQGELTFSAHFIPFLPMFQGYALAAKFLALSNGWNSPRYRRLVFSLFLVPFAIALFFAVTPYFQLRSILFAISGIVVCAACIFAVSYNRYWNGLVGRSAMLVNFCLSAAAYVWRANASWPFASNYAFFGTGREKLLTLTLLVILSFLAQMAFLLMLTGRTQRRAEIKKRRAERIRTRAVSLKLQNKEISRLLDEQRRMLETLTHEVRQPINNAQAALQGIMSELHGVNEKRTLPIAIRIQGILDGITLSLSNAIIGATLVERGEGSELRECEIISIAQLALHDCPATLHERIICDFPASDIFLAADPILLRLALRNLLDNAAKFSPTGTEIIFSIALDEARFGVLISVTNAVPSSFLFERHMVKRGKRGSDDDIAGKEGSGIGLHIVSEVARIHGRSMVVEHDEPGKVTFGMLLAE